jgi:hypothetical protein
VFVRYTRCVASPFGKGTTDLEIRLAVAVSSLDLKFMARSAALYAMRLSGGSYLNMSRRLVRWMKRVHLPITPLRMRYVRLVHVPVCVYVDECPWMCGAPASKKHHEVPLEQSNMGGARIGEGIRLLGQRLVVFRHRFASNVA